MLFVPLPTVVSRSIVRSLGIFLFPLSLFFFLSFFFFFFLFPRNTDQRVILRNEATTRPGGYGTGATGGISRREICGNFSLPDATMYLPVPSLLHIVSRKIPRRAPAGHRCSEKVV